MEVYSVVSGGIVVEVCGVGMHSVARSLVWDRACACPSCSVVSVGAACSDRLFQTVAGLVRLVRMLCQGVWQLQDRGLLTAIVVAWCMPRHLAGSGLRVTMRQTCRPRGPTASMQWRQRSSWAP